MTTEDKKAPAENIEDVALDDAQAGIALLLQAVQKVREAAARSETASIAKIDAVGMKVRKG